MKNSAEKKSQREEKNIKVEGEAKRGSPGFSGINKDLGNFLLPLILKLLTNIKYLLRVTLSKTSSITTSLFF